MIKAPKTLAIVLSLAGGIYGLSFWGMVSVDAESAWSRFEELTASKSYGRAVGHGEHAIALRLKDGDDGEALQLMQRRTADAHFDGGNPERAIMLYKQVLTSPLGSQMSDAERFEIRKRIAALNFTNGTPIEAAIIIAEFVDAAGDGAARLNPDDDNDQSVQFLEFANASIGDFTDSLPPLATQEIIPGDTPTRLRAAEQLTNLGGYYTRVPNAEYAAAGLLATAYRTRFDVLGPDDEDTVHTGLLLAPIYERIGRIKDAENIYLDAFHAQERAKGPNSPELSLYIRLLSDVYRRQGRITEAEALNVHMRTLFRDAFGARRYAANRDRDRRADINRPVSSEFPLSANYTPTDLIAAIRYSIPLSKNSGIDEMKIRTAAIDDETNMPKMLADLIIECQTDKERLSLRSGYRSYTTQRVLHARPGHGGTVTEPGTSEHQLGLAADIDVNRRLMRSTDRAYQCFESQAWRFGFILSYPRGNTYLKASDSYEPWHWRFVGPRTALLYRETGPMGYPQEFLAALPCYEERALAGLFRSAGEADVCLESVIGKPEVTAMTATENNDG